MKRLEGKKAYLYARVSTTDQKDNGYSLPQQKMFLYDFCERNGIQVLDYYEEDHTSTTFARPKYSDLLKQLKKEKADYILFHKWDRFSREPEGLTEVDKLRLSGIEPNSISEWVDFSDSCYYLYLGIHILQAKVENVKRSERTRNGIIGALKEGRNPNHAPIGYINARDPQNPNKPFMVRCPEKAPLIKKIFEDFATGNHTIEALRRKYSKLGIKRSKSQFSELLSNIKYIGKLIVPAHENYPQEIINGLHEPIVSEALFLKVQRIKNGKITYSINSESKNKNDEALPLRGGILQCAKCGRNLTGSCSKSGSGWGIYYYHCHRNHGCHENLPAIEVNTKLVELLQILKPNKDVIELFKAVLEDEYKTHYIDREKQIRRLNDTRKSIEERLDRLTESYVSNNDIDKPSYVRLKNKYNEELSEIIIQLSETADQSKDINKFVGFGLQLLMSIDDFYVNADVTVKRQIIRSIFAEKLVYENKKYRTPKYNEAVLFIFNNKGRLQRLRNKKGELISKPSYSVARTGLEPVTFGL